MQRFTKNCITGLFKMGKILKQPRCPAIVQRNSASTNYYKIFLKNASEKHLGKRENGHVLILGDKKTEYVIL